MAEKIEVSKIDKNTKSGTYIDIERKDGKFFAVVTDFVAGERQPSRRGFLNVIGKGENAFMTVQAPLREVGEDGQFLTRAKQKDGKFLDAKGKVVESEAQAAREYVYKTQKNDTSKLVYGQIATMNVTNTKGKDDNKTPNAFTMITVKLFNDDEALQAERHVFKLAALREKEKQAGVFVEGQDSEECKTVKDAINKSRKETGRYENFFITKGAEVLREMGFTIREKEPKADTPEPA
jgi:hypothetical protein